MMAWCLFCGCVENGLVTEYTHFRNENFAKLNVVVQAYHLSTWESEAELL